MSTRPLLVALLLAACGSPPAGPQGEPEALALLERARAHHGSDALDDATVRFSFRGTPFVVERADGAFRYARTLTDEQGRTVEEVVDNDGPHRFVDGVEVPLDEAEAARLTTAVNSVVYFALLPAPLADPAVRARRLAPDTLGGTPYDRVEVTFARDGGGLDFDDRYVYWLGADGEVGHYAYTFAVAPGDTARAATGTRFRVPIGQRRVDGVLFQDWRNLSADSLGDLAAFGAAYERGETFVVSDVVLDSVRVIR